MKSRIPVILVTALVTAIVTSLLWAGGLYLLFGYYFSDQPSFQVRLDLPASATVGEEILLEAEVLNAGDSTIELDGVDVYDSFLEGFEVLDVLPTPRSLDPSMGFASYYYSQDLAPGETFEFQLLLRAKTPGTWTGDVDFCDASLRFVTSTVTVRVLPE